MDLAAWDPALPSTRIAGTVDAQPANGGLAGKLDFQNSQTGTFDTDRVPIRALSAQFAWTRDTIAFDAINAEVTGGGRATGQGRATLGAVPRSGNLHLDVRDVDLRQLFPRLIATRLAGAIDVNLDTTERTVAGTLADRGIAGGISLEFALAIDDRAAIVKRLRARAGPGEAIASSRTPPCGMSRRRAGSVARP